MAEPKKINFQSHLCLYFSEIYNPPNYKSFMKSKFFRILKKHIKIQRNYHTFLDSLDSRKFHNRKTTSCPKPHFPGPKSSQKK